MVWLGFFINIYIGVFMCLLKFGFFFFFSYKYVMSEIFYLITFIFMKSFLV